MERYKTLSASEPQYSDTPFLPPGTFVVTYTDHLRALTAVEQELGKTRATCDKLGEERNRADENLYHVKLKMEAVEKERDRLSRREAELQDDVESLRELCVHIRHERDNARDAAELQRREREKTRELLHAEVQRNQTLEQERDALKGERDKLVEIVGCAPAYLLETLEAVMKVYHDKADLTRLRQALELCVERLEGLKEDGITKAEQAALDAARQALSATRGMSYTRSLQTKLVRCVHKVTILDSQSSNSIKADLAQVPDGLHVSVHEGSGEIRLEFTEEKEQP